MSNLYLAVCLLVSAAIGLLGDPMAFIVVVGILGLSSWLFYKVLGR